MILLKRIWYLIIWVLYICFVGSLVLPLIVFLVKGTIYVEEFCNYTENLLL